MWTEVFNHPFITSAISYLRFQNILIPQLHVDSLTFIPKGADEISSRNPFEYFWTFQVWEENNIYKLDGMISMHEI